MPRAPVFSVAFSVLVLLVLGYASYALFVPPRNFPAGHLIELPDDALVGDMGEILAERGAVRSAFAFRLYARLTFQDRSLASGLYVFDRPVGLMALTHRLANGEHGISPARVTFTEGMTISDMGRELKNAIPDFDTRTFLSLASTSEGYLFPDTYFLLPDSTPDEVMARLGARFDEQMATIQDAVAASGRNPNELVIMASILEREAKTPEDMRIVAGILWKRLDTGMPLQVDAPFGYMHDENGYVPTARDLASDSPYNTYRNEGLPPGPIANPGLTALLAAATPEASDYLYYLTGRDGAMHYGRTFEDHKRNRALYLD
ncbi:MAG: hypothetical protein QOE22_763 [Candidatus Parcubacteria bacterium]|nr:hypothetical protein [Candidatus Parcubacteria bacterium]